MPACPHTATGRGARGQAGGQHLRRHAVDGDDAPGGARGPPAGPRHKARVALRRPARQGEADQRAERRPRGGEGRRG